MGLKIVSLYASILAIIFIILSVRTIRMRRKAGTAIGLGTDASLQRAIRAHGNFAEYVPLVLILMMLLEMNDGSVIVLHGCGVAFVVGRILHAYGISNANEVFKWRVSGMILTFTVLSVLIGFNLLQII